MAQDLFSTYLHSTRNIKLSDSLKTPCQQLLKQISPHVDYPNGITSYYDKSIQKQHQTNFQPFIDYALDQAKEYLKFISVKTDEVNIELVSWWVSNTGKDGSHEAHTHTPGSVLSGTYYIDIDPNSSQIVFYDFDADYDILSYLPKDGYNRHNSSVWFVPPEEGLMLMWPSNLRHSVQTNKTDKRVAISFKKTHVFL